MSKKSPRKSKSLLSQMILILSGILLLSVGLLYIPTFFKIQSLQRDKLEKQLQFTALKMASHIDERYPQAELVDIPLAQICRRENQGGLGAALLEKNTLKIRSLCFTRQQLNSLKENIPSHYYQVDISGNYLAVVVPLKREGNLLVSIPDRTVYDSYSYFVYIAALMIVSLFLAGALLIYALYQMVLKPMEDLIVANLGTLEDKPESLLIPDAQIPNNEIGETMRHRNRHIRKLLEFRKRIEEQNEELRSHQRELESWSRELEARVEAKTKELKTAEEHLIRAEKLAALGKLASGVAHEVNNPLASIAGYAEDMIETFREQRSFSEEEMEEFIDSLQIIEDQAYRLKDLTRKLLNFARETKIHLEEVDLNHLIDETISLISLKSRKELPISTQLDSDLPPVYTDRSKLQQVFMNLLDNAADAVEEGGEVNVLTRRVNGNVKIIFKDTGEGIPWDIQSRIFDPFFTTKPVGSGTGLGLSICYGIIKKLKGKIEFDSIPSSGASFVVSLPLKNKGKSPSSLHILPPAQSEDGCKSNESS